MKSWLEPAVVAVIVSALVSALVSIAGNDIIDSRSKARQAKIEEVLKFTSSDDDIMTTSGQYIKDIIASSDLGDVSDKLRTDIGRQVRRAEDLKILFPNDRDVQMAITAYENSLLSYSESIKDAVGPTKMRTWEEKLGDVSDKRRALTTQLLRVAKVIS